MSAFVVRDKTINRVVTWMVRSDDLHRTRDRISKTLGGDWCTETLGHALFHMNVDAVNQRYSPGQAAEFRPLDYCYAVELANDYQVLKSLRSLLYQCSEGNVPESELYKAMDELSHTLALKIIGRLPEYDRAEWD